MKTYRLAEYERKIEIIYERYEELKKEDITIDVYDSESLKTRKNVILGKLFAYEEVIKLFQDEK